MAITKTTAFIQLRRGLVEQQNRSALYKDFEQFDSGAFPSGESREWTIHPYCLERVRCGRNAIAAGNTIMRSYAG